LKLSEWSLVEFKVSAFCSTWPRKGSRTESAAAGGIQIEQNGTHEQSNGQSNGRVREAACALLSPVPM